MKLSAVFKAGTAAVLAAQGAAGQQAAAMAEVQVAQGVQENKYNLQDQPRVEYLQQVYNFTSADNAYGRSPAPHAVFSVDVMPMIRANFALSLDDMGNEAGGLDKFGERGLHIDRATASMDIPGSDFNVEFGKFSGLRGALWKLQPAGLFLLGTEASHEWRIDDQFGARATYKGRLFQSDELRAEVSASRTVPQFNVTVPNGTNVDFGGPSDAWLPSFVGGVSYAGGNAMEMGRVTIGAEFSHVSATNRDIGKLEKGEQEKGEQEKAARFAERTFGLSAKYEFTFLPPFTLTFAGELAHAGHFAGKEDGATMGTVLGMLSSRYDTASEGFILPYVAAAVTGDSGNGNSYFGAELGGTALLGDRLIIRGQYGIGAHNKHGAGHNMGAGLGFKF